MYKRQAYYASDAEGGKTGLDLFTFQLPEALAASPTKWVKGNVLDAKTKQPVQATIMLRDTENRNRQSRVKANKDGTFLATLPVNSNITFNVQQTGYLFYSEHFFIRPGKDSAQVVDIFLEPLAGGVSVTLKNLLFATNKAVPLDASAFELERLKEFMQQNPTVRIGIYGHTDNVGKPADNIKLSNERTRSVANYLVQNGIAAHRMVTKGFGETKPIAPNTTEEGRAKNRRTEIVVL